MLKKLIVENVALVPYTEIIFGNGLSVLTGETGAGKSIIVSALSLALGERADKDNIRHNEDYASVTAVFDVSNMPTSYKRQHEIMIEDNRITIERIISRDSSSKILINGKSSTLHYLGQVAAPLAEIMGQHSNQMLMNEENHLDFLDDFGGITPLRETISEIFYDWKRVTEELRRTLVKHEELAHERDLLLFQKNEIEKAGITVGEEENLNEERQILDSARSLLRSSALIKTLLDEQENSALEQLGIVQKELQRMSNVDSKLIKKVEQLNDSVIQLQELSQSIEQYGTAIADDPIRLENINLRLDEIYRLKKKYGGSEKAIVGTLEVINSKLDERPDINVLTSKLEAESNRLQREYREQALKLSDTRKKTAAYLEKLVIKELTELGIERPKFEFEFVYSDDPEGVVVDNKAVKAYPEGLEKGRIMFSANEGEPLKPLVKCASGGEISRILLALKSAAKSSNKTSHALMVFDEVDAGIGGQTAAEVGSKLKKLSQQAQVLVITHLHQIARLANHHYLAEKTSTFGRSTIAVNKLEKPAIAAELERMVALPQTSKSL
ncbi:MAG: DNA repair protein RecN [candidate division Zixibacteria bacterium]